MPQESYLSLLMKLHWKPCATTSALHAVRAIALGQALTDPRIAPALVDLSQFGAFGHELKQTDSNRSFAESPLLA
mgnify:CR=1 FL=1